MAVKFDVRNLLQTLSCPIGLDPLTTAVNLFPCCHKINQVAAERYYGKIADGSCELKGKSCVVCKSPVTSYAPDHTVRSLAEQVFGYEEDLQELSTHPLESEKEKAKDVLQQRPAQPPMGTDAFGWCPVCL